MNTKDLSFLLQLLRTSKQSGMLFVEPPGSPQSSWQGQFRLVNGTVTACLVYNKTDGRVLLSNNEALRWLTGQGKLVWHLEDTQGLDTRPAHEEIDSDQRQGQESLPSAAWKYQLRGIPYRTQQGRNLPTDAFTSREHLQVFALIDGRRTIEEIIYLLHRSPDVIIRVLQELQEAGLIA